MPLPHPKRPEVTLNHTNPAQAIRKRVPSLCFMFRGPTFQFHRGSKCNSNGTCQESQFTGFTANRCELASHMRTEFRGTTVETCEVFFFLFVGGESRENFSERTRGRGLSIRECFPFWKGAAALIAHWVVIFCKRLGSINFALLGTSSEGWPLSCHVKLQEGAAKAEVK